MPTPRMARTPAQLESGLFYSSLDTQQTKSDGQSTAERREPRRTAEEKEWDKFYRGVEYELPAASPTETAFRHRSWLANRDRVRGAFTRLNVPRNRRTRFEECGGDCVIEMAEDDHRLRVRANYCGDRFCEACCRGRSRKIASNVAQWIKGQELRFVTLTMEPSTQRLSKIVDHLIASFAKLREQKLWSNAVDAGCYFIEITRGTAGDHWHVHCHVLTAGRYINQSDLSRAWKVASGGSYIVDVRAVKDREKTVRYVAKYATKGWSEQILRDNESLDECMTALRGRRLLGTFGTWRSMKMDEQPADETKWKSVGRLDEIAAAAARGADWAVGLLHGLGVVVKSKQGRMVFAADPAG